jgi:hypothetical protein
MKFKRKLKRCIYCNKRVWFLNNHIVCKWYEFVLHDDQGVGP